MNEKQKKLLSENYDFIENKLKQYSFVPPQDYEECKSYVLYMICQQIEAFDKNKGNIRVYLSVMIRTLVYKYCNETRANPSVIDKQISYSDKPDYWEDRQSKEIKEAISELDNTNQHIILLYYFDGLTEKEIGAILGISHQAVSKRLHKALDKLRPILKERINRLNEIRSEL